MSKIKVTDTREMFSPNPARRGMKDTLVVYQVDGLHTYMITLPSEGITPDKITEAIRQDVQARSQVVGKEFEV